MILTVLKEMKYFTHDPLLICFLNLAYWPVSNILYFISIQVIAEQFAFNAATLLLFLKRNYKMYYKANHNGLYIIQANLELSALSESGVDLK